MKATILVPKKADKLAAFKLKYPFLFNDEGEQYTPEDLEQNEIDILVANGIMTVETPETKAPALDLSKAETPAETVAPIANKAIQKIGDFTFKKMVNTKQTVERIMKFFSREETVARNLENGIEGAKESPSVLLNFATEGLFGSANIAFEGLTISSAKGTKSICVINSPISETEFQENKNAPQNGVKFTCEEFRISKGDKDLKELVFQTDLQGSTESKEYRCYGIINNVSNKTLYMVVPYDSDANQFSIGGKFFNNVAEFN